MMPATFFDLSVFSSPSAPVLLFLLKATILLLAALGVTIAMQRASAGSRHLVWLVALGSLLILPALAAWSPLRLEILPATREQARAPVSPNSPPASESQTSVIPSATATDRATEPVAQASNAVAASAAAP